MNATDIATDIGTVLWRPGVISRDEAHLAIAGQTVHTQPVTAYGAVHAPVYWHWSVCADQVEARREASGDAPKCEKCVAWLAQHGTVDR